MILALKHMTHDNDRIDGFISAWTNSKFIHAQIIFKDGSVGSSWIDTGVALKKAKDCIDYPFLFTFVKIRGIDEQKVYNYIKSQLGKKFDMVSSIFLKYLPFDKGNRLHCSEVCYKALKEGGLQTKEDLKPETVTPQNLYDMVINNQN